VVDTLEVTGNEPLGAIQARLLTASSWLEVE
jgi:hypothetical protein